MAVTKPPEYTELVRNRLGGESLSRTALSRARRWISWLGASRWTCQPLGRILAFPVSVTSESLTLYEYPLTSVPRIAYEHGINTEVRS